MTYAQRPLVGPGFPFISYLRCYKRASRVSAPTRITWCHPNDADRYVLISHRIPQNKSGIPKARDIDVLRRQHRHVTDAQRASSIAPSSLHLFPQLSPGFRSSVTFSRTSHFHALPSYPFHKKPTKTNEKPQHRKHGHPLHD